MTEHQERSTEHLRWLIKSRSENQQAAVDLYDVLNRFPKSGQTHAGQSLVAIAFSLWRAAFLADRTGKLRARSEKATVFLHKMIGDNAITYTQDRESREWTFKYYLDNAGYRLKDLANSWPEISDLILPQGRRSGTNRWAQLQAAFARAVKIFADNEARKHAEISDLTTTNPGDRRPIVIIE